MDEEPMSGVLVFYDSADEDFREHVQETLETSEFITTNAETFDGQEVVSVSEIPEEEVDDE